MSELSKSFALDLAERGLLPDSLIRAGIRHLCRVRLEEERRRYSSRDALGELLEEMHRGPVAPLPHKANEQHYEAPVELFLNALGPRLKYSCCYWPEDATTLGEAEEAALQITCERAEIEDGQEILELGCGWGSLSLWIAERYPNSRILAVSNSRPQRQFINAMALRKGLENLNVVTADMNEFHTERRFDHVVSVEMFEHMRNYSLLLERVSTWMKPAAKLFIHVFCHRDFAYEFQTAGAGNWLGRYFFTGGIMPSEGLLHYFQKHVKLAEQWRWPGTHYQKTADAWLVNLDAAKSDLLPIFEKTYGTGEARRWFQRWRIFFMACAELWGFRRGEEWFVAHYLLEKRPVRVLEFRPAGRVRQKDRSGDVMAAG